MKRALVLVVLAVVLVAVVVIVGVGSETSWTAAEEVEIEASPTIVASYVRDLRRWPRWAPWVEAAGTTREFDGDSARRGGRLRFSRGGVVSMPAGTLLLQAVKLDPDGGGVVAFDVDDGVVRQFGEIEVGGSRPTVVRLVLSGDVWGDAEVVYGEARSNLASAATNLKKVAEAEQQAADEREAAQAEAEARRAARIEAGDPVSGEREITAEEAQKQMILRRVIGGP